MFSPEEVVCYLDMCREKEVSLQLGINYRLCGGVSIILMSRRKGALAVLPENSAEMR